jgi:hypothetical protein
MECFGLCILWGVDVEYHGVWCVYLLFGTGEVGVLLSVGIFFKLLGHCFVNGVIVVGAKFVHVYFLFTG